MMLNKENLERARLESEAEFYKALTQEIFQSKNPVQKKSKTWVRGLSIGLLTAFVGLLSGSFALYRQFNDFLDQRRKAYSVTYTNQMIEFVNRLKEDNNWESDQAILLLSSYELDALPILLFNLENETPDRKEVYLRSLKMIINKPTVDKKRFLEIIMKNSKEYLLSKFDKTYSEDEEQQQKIYALRNYIFIISSFYPEYPDLIKEHLIWMRDKIEKDTFKKETQRKLLISRINETIE